MPDTTSDTAKHWHDEAAGTDAAPAGDGLDELEDTLPRRAITAKDPAANTTAQDPRLARDASPPPLAPAQDDALAAEPGGFEPPSEVEAATGRAQPDATSIGTEISGQSAEDLPTLMFDPGDTQPVRDETAPPAVVLPPKVTLPFPRVAHPPQTSQVAPEPPSPTVQPAASVTPSHVATVVEPATTPLPPQTPPPPPRAYSRTVDISGIHTRVPQQYWLDEDPLERTRLDLGLSGRRPVVREAGRPLPKPRRFRRLARWESALILLIVLVIIALTCIGIVEIAAQFLAHPAHTAPIPTHTALPTSTVSSH